MKRLVHALALLALIASATSVTADEEAQIALEAPSQVDDLRLEDVTGDGTADVLLLCGRQVTVYRGRADALPAAAPSWTVTLPTDVTFVDVVPPDPSGSDAEDGAAPTLFLLGKKGARTLSLDGGAPTPIPGVATRLDWVDATQAAFADLVQEDGSLLLPTLDGWTRIPRPGDGGIPVSVAAALRRDVRPPGGFVEDVGVVTRAHGPVAVGPALRPGSTAVLWALGEGRLTAATPFGTAAADVSYLPPQGERRLRDLDGDGTPEVMHLEWDSQDAALAVFHAPPLVLEDGKLVTAGEADLRPPAAVLRLPGYLIQHELRDLNGDGLLDFVVTTIPVDARNTLRALGGRVTAHTKAFLCRGPETRTYTATPDAAVSSDIGIEIRFSQAGTIEIHRYFTIVTGGDFDGDGRLDLALRTAPETLTIRAGTAGGVWTTKGRHREIPPPGESLRVDAFTADLDADERDELVLVYRGVSGRPDRVWIMAAP